jgi:hypothetical protein
LSDDGARLAAGRVAVQQEDDAVKSLQQAKLNSVAVAEDAVVAAT